MAQVGKAKDSNTVYVEVQAGKFAPFQGSYNELVSQYGAPTIHGAGWKPTTIISWPTSGGGGGSAQAKTTTPTPVSATSGMVNKAPTPGIPTTGLTKQGNTYFLNGVAISSLEEAKQLGVSLGTAKDITPQAGTQQLLAGLQGQLDQQQPDALSAIFGSLKPPEQFSMEEAYGAMRSEAGMADLDQGLADIDVKIADLIALTEGAVAQESKSLAPLAEIRRRQEKISTEQQIELNRLVNIRQAKQQQIDNKNATIGMMMQLKAQDYQMAYQTYTDSYNRAIQFYQIITQEQRQLQQDSLANLNVVLESMRENNISWESLTPTMQTSMQSLALKANFDPEFLPTLTQISNKLETVGSPIVSDNGDVSVIQQDAQGNLSVKVLQGVTSPKTTGGSATKGWSKITVKGQPVGRYNSLTGETIYDPFPNWFRDQIEMESFASYPNEYIQNAWEGYIDQLGLGLIEEEEEEEEKDLAQWEKEAQIWEWLGSDGAMAMSNEEKALEIIKAGGNPEDFGLWTPW